MGFGHFADDAQIGSRDPGFWHRFVDGPWWDHTTAKRVAYVHDENFVGAAKKLPDGQWRHVEQCDWGPAWWQSRFKLARCAPKGFAAGLIMFTVPARFAEDLR